jgi:Holliday junction resolvase
MKRRELIEHLEEHGCEFLRVQIPEPGEQTA